MTEIRNRNPPLNVSDGNPDPISYREAVRFLAHRLYLRSATYRTQRVQANVVDLCPELADFVQGFLGMMESLTIPAICDVGYLSRADEARLYVLGVIDAMSATSPHATGRTVSLCHAVRGRNLSPMCWDVFAHVGKEVAQKRGIKGVQWGGSAAPWSWCITP